MEIDNVINYYSSWHFMKNLFKIRAQFDYLHEILNDFCYALEQAEVHHARYFQLPSITKNEENHAPESIPVQQLSGKAAIIAGCKGYQDLFLQDKASGKVLQRHPGIFVFADPTHVLQRKIEQINQAKADFKALILNIEHPDARFEAVHSAVPQLITLAAYRKIHYETRLPYSIRFTWMQKHATKTLNKEHALAMLNRSSRYTHPRMIDQQHWSSLVEAEKKRVNALDARSKLRIRRPTRITPEVNVRFSAKERYHVSAALPFLLLNSTPDVKFGDLPSYQRTESHPRKRPYQFLVERLYLEALETQV